MQQICLPDNSDNTGLQNLEQHKSFHYFSTHTGLLYVSPSPCASVCVSWWHWLAKASLCSGFLPGPIRSTLEPACCLCVWLLGKETKRLIVSLLSSHAAWLSFINMMHFCVGRNRSAPLRRWQTALKHSSVLIVIVLKKSDLFSRSEHRLGRVELSCSLPQQNRSPGFGCRYEACPFLDSLVCNGRTKTEKRGRRGRG